MSVVSMKYDRPCGGIGLLIFAFDESAFLTNASLGVLKNALSVSAPFVELTHITFPLMAVFSTYESASAFRTVVLDLAIVSPNIGFIFDVTVFPKPSISLPSTERIRQPQFRGCTQVAFPFLGFHEVAVFPMLFTESGIVMLVNLQS